MSGTDEFLAGLLQALADFFEPIDHATDDVDALVTLLSQLGWTVDPATAAVPAELTAIAGSVVDLAQQVPELASGDDSRVETAESAALGDVTGIALGVAQLANVTTLPDAFKDPRLPEKLMALLVYDYLSDHKPRIFAITRLLGILDEKLAPAPGTSPFARPYLERTVDFSRVATLVTDPARLPATVYGWGTTDFEADTVLRVFEVVGRAFGLPGSNDMTAGLHLYWDAATVRQQAQRALVIPLWSGVVASGHALASGQLDLVVVPIPAATAVPGTPTTKPEGLAVFPRFDGSIAASIDLADGITLGVKGEIEDEGIVRAELRPTGSELKFDGSPADIDDVKVTVRLDVAPTEPSVVLGAKTSSRLEIAQAHAGFGIEVKLGKPEMSVDVGLDKASIVIDLGKGDGFLQKLLGGEPQQLDFGFGLGWATETGVRFNGTATLRLEIPVHLDLAGVVQIETIHLVLGAVVAPQPGLDIEVSVTGGLTLGPFAAQVDRIGVKMDLVERADHKGALGDMDLVFGFKPPNGLGFVVDAGPVKGGGYVSFDFEKGEYAGILDLEVADKFAIKAIGILATKMPDGRPGFSMLLIITAEFPPIQLGYGFTLNGVGGAIGINRTMNGEFLRDGIHTGALESILFPPDPVAHANEVISNLKQGFPIAQDRFIFGPMVKLGWASIITVEAGILLELPMPIRLAILGRLSCILPDKDSGILVLQLDMLGLIDFGTGDIAIDADLVDSKIVTFPLTGGFAMRANVGAHPNFAVSAGGFHPRFTPPADFPSLKRLGLSISSGDNPRLRAESYFALTTNTVQAGARIDFHAAADFGTAGSFSADAEIGFDTLIHFSPLELEANLYGSASVKRNGDDLCSADLELVLTGPTPWHARGHAIVHFLGDHSLAFDRTFGPDASPQALPAVNVADLVRAAVGLAESWGATPPDGEHSLVMLRDIGAAVGVLLHPRARISVHQHVAPVDTPIAKFNNGPIAGPATISIDAVTITGVVTHGTDTLDDDFAPAQFFALTDDQKLTRPSFEKLPAGRSIQVSAFATGPAEKADQHYVTIAVDNPELTPFDDRLAGLAAAYRAKAALRDGMAELVGNGLVGPGRYAAPSQGIGVAEPAWKVAGKRDLVATGTHASYTAAVAAGAGDGERIVGAFEAR